MKKKKTESFFHSGNSIIDFSLLPLINKELDFEAIRLTEPDGNIIRFSQEEFNFSDLL